MSGNVPEPLLDPEQESSVLPGQALRTLLRELVRRNFLQPLGITDSEITSYVSDLLAEFSRTENLYRIRDSRGKRLEDIGQMLAASDPLHEASSFEREREVRKHIGDFTLFFAGLFPEALNHWRLRRQRLESVVDYVRAGKESYFIVAAFNQFEYRGVAPLFQKMSEQFETCVFGLNLVKRDLQGMQQQAYVRAQQLLF